MNCIYCGRQPHHCDCDDYAPVLCLECDGPRALADVRDSSQIGTVPRCRPCIVKVDPRYADVWEAAA